MGETFKVGEIAILCNLVVRPERNGQEVTILSELRPLRCREWFSETTWEINTKPRYLIRLADGTTHNVQAHKLRKRREPPPPLDFTAGEWDLIPWKPARKVAST